MQLTGRILLHCGIVVFYFLGVQSACTDFTEFNTLIDLMQHDRCYSADKVITLLNTLHDESVSSCKRAAIDKLAEHFKDQADTLQYCHCISSNHRDTTHVKPDDNCYNHNSDYKALYDQYFSHARHHHCESHHRLWAVLSRMSNGKGEHCQQRIIEVIGGALGQGENFCSCSGCPFSCGFHGKCHIDGCHCINGYQGDKCEIAPTTTSSTMTPTHKTTTRLTTTPVAKPATVTTTLASTLKTMTTSTLTTSSTTVTTITTDRATATTPPRTTETIKTQQTTDPIITTQQHSTSFPKCNHTCTLDAVILSEAVKHSKSDNCSSATSASNEALPMECCNMGEHKRWIQGAQVQTSMVCTDGNPAPYTPIAAYNGTELIPDSAGIFYGCIKNGQSGFMMVHQACDRLPQLMHVNVDAGKDPNIYYIIN